MYERTKISDVLAPGMPDDWDGSALPPDFVENWGRVEATEPHIDNGDDDE